MRNKIISHYYCDDDKIIREVVSCLKMLFLSFIISVARIWKKKFKKSKKKKGEIWKIILNPPESFSSNENIELATLIIILTKHIFLHSFICKYKTNWVECLTPQGVKCAKSCMFDDLTICKHFQLFVYIFHSIITTKDKGCRSESWHFEKKLWRSDEWRWGVDYVLSGQGVIF